MTQPIDKGNEVRREGALATQEKYDDYMSKNKSPYDDQNGPGSDGTIEGKRVRKPNLDGGYVGSVPVVERNDDTRHPDTKIWVRRDRKPDDYLHTGNG
jgi:hypothetical protein